MRISLLIGTLCLGMTCVAETANTDAKLEFENDWVRVVRVHYNAHETTAMHDHPALPTVYIYTTDGGKLRISHDAERDVIRPAVKAGGIRFQKGVAERHVVEELDGIASEYLRLELKTQPADLPERDIRIPAGDNTPYESAMIRIERVRCAANSRCPASEHPERPAVVVAGGRAQWFVPRALSVVNSSPADLDEVRVEFKTPPAKR